MFASTVLGVLTWSENMMVILTRTIPEVDVGTIPSYCLHYGNKCHIFHHLEKWSSILWIDTLRPRQNDRHFPNNIFKCILLNENIWISLNISLKFVPQVPINNIPALVQIMAWRRPGDKPLSGPMMVKLPTHICVTRPQWINGCCMFICLNGDGAKSKYLIKEVIIISP